MENPTPDINSLASDGCIGCLFIYCIFLALVVGGMLFGGPIVLLFGVGIVGIILFWLLELVVRAINWILQFFK